MLDVENLKSLIFVVLVSWCPLGGSGLMGASVFCKALALLIMLTISSLSCARMSVKILAFLYLMLVKEVLKLLSSFVLMSPSIWTSLAPASIVSSLIFRMYLLHLWVWVPS